MMRTGSGYAELCKKKRELREVMSVCRQQLLFKFPFTASVMMRNELVPVRDVRLSTASTDGRRIFVDIDFFRGLEESDRIFVLAHEVWHGLLLHPLRGQGYERARFNIAVDMEVNRLLAKDGFAVPKDALMPPCEWDGFSAEEMYERIDVEELPAGGGAVSGQFDQHIDIDDVFLGDKGIDPDYLPLVASDLAESVAAAAVAAAQQFERRKGSLPAHLKDFIKLLRPAELDWREMLARFVTRTFGGSRRWLPPNRRFLSRGIYLQSSRQERLQAVVAVDTSGSVIQDLPAFFGELQSLLGSFGSYDVTVIQCDAEIQSVEMFDGAETFDASKVVYHGGGGTDFRPVFRYIEEHLEACPSVLVYLTDGYGDVDVEGPDYPVLWVLTHDGRKPCEWGDSVHFKNKEDGGR